MKYMEDKRGGPRHRVTKPGTIGFNGSGNNCLVCNVSQSGAAIEIKGSVCIPAAFNLMIDSGRINKTAASFGESTNVSGVTFIWVLLPRSSVNSTSATKISSSGATSRNAETSLALIVPSSANVVENFVTVVSG